MSEWISVKDRLPEHHHTVLFCTSDVREPVMFPLQGYYDKHEDVWVGYIWSQKRKDVTHWMPVPEPPSESNPDFKEWYAEHKALKKKLGL